MNAIRQTQQLNKRELENATPPSASWHADYRDTAWVYVGGLPLDLTEGDVVTICSQFGNPTHLNLIRDRETGKSKGFGFLKYEDQRSCDLAVDNLTGADVLGRLLRVDHTRYKKKDDEDENTYRIDRLEAEAQTDLQLLAKRASDTEDETDGERRSKRRRHAPRDDDERLAITASGEHDEDPMKDYLNGKKTSSHRDKRNRHDDSYRTHKHRHRHREDRDTRTGKDREHRRQGSDRRNREDLDSASDTRHTHRNSTNSGIPHRRRRRDSSGSPGSISENDDSSTGVRRKRRSSRKRSRSRSEDEIVFSGRTRGHEDRQDRRRRFDDSP